MSYKKFLHTAFVKTARKYVAEKRKEAYFFIKKNSPVKSSHYTNATYTTQIIETDTMVYSSIVNAMNYSLKVEEGWRSKPVNWHLADGSIYRAKWARVFERAKKFLSK